MAASRPSLGPKTSFSPTASLGGSPLSRPAGLGPTTSFAQPNFGDPGSLADEADPADGTTSTQMETRSVYELIITRSSADEASEASSASTTSASGGTPDTPAESAKRSDRSLWQGGWQGGAYSQRGPYKPQGYGGRPIGE